MTVVPLMLCAANQWPADDFWHSVRCAVRIVEGELTMIKPDADEIEQMILRSWLDFSAPAGNA